MNIIIKRNIGKELYCFKTKIKLMSNGVRAAIVLFLFGVCAIIVCQNDFGITENSFTCYIVLEIIVFGISFTILKRVYDYRRLYKNFEKSALKDYENLETYSTVTIDDSYFTYESVNKFYKLSWSSFVKYDVKNECLVLMMNESYSLAFIIRRKELTPDEFKELHRFVSQKIQLKK